MRFTNTGFAVIFLLLAVSTLGDSFTPDSIVEMTLGKVPLKRAIVVRTINHGKTQYVDAYSLHFQLDTWAVEQIEAQAALTGKEVPVDGGMVSGRSRTHIWRLNKYLVDLADLNNAIGSVPAIAAEQSQSVLSDFLSLGMPFADSTHPIWAGEDVKRIPPALIERFKRDESTDSPTSGHYVFDVSRRPISAEFQTALGNVDIRYTYANAQSPFPAEIRRTFTDPRLPSTVMKVVLFEPGVVDLAATDGYVPQLFTDTKTPRPVTIYTNSEAFGVYDGALVPEISRGGNAQAARSAFISVSLVIGFAFALLLWRGIKTKTKE